MYNVYTDDLNHHLQAAGVGCYVGGVWVNSLSNVDDMVLLAPTVTALQTLLELCRAYAGPHDIVYNTTKTVCMLVRPKQSQGRYSTGVRLGNEKLSFVQEFSYLGHVMTAHCRNDKDIKKQFMSSHLHLLGQNPTVQVILLPHLWMCSLIGVIHTRTLLKNLLSVLVTHSSVL